MLAPRERHISPLRLWCAMVLLLWELVCAEPIEVRYAQGSVHGFLTLSTLQGQLLATGDLNQVVHGQKVRAHLVFRFRDGSTDDETTVFSQTGKFRLVSDHHIQRGPSFPHPMDVFINAVTGEVTTRTEDSGRKKIETQHLEVPPDVANGLIPTLLTNIASTANETIVSYVGGSSKPRVVHLVINPAGEDVFSIAITRYKATHFRIKVDIGGIAGVVAPIVGKKPTDTDVWIVADGVPAFVRTEGALFEGGPIWRIDSVSPVWASSNHSTD